MHKDSKSLKRVCSLLHIKPEKVDDYLKAHQVWPELLEVMREAGMRNFSLFLQKETGLVVEYFEAEDPEKSLREVGKTDVSRRWEEAMEEFFTPESAGTNNDRGEWLEQYFNLE